MEKHSPCKADLKSLVVRPIWGEERSTWDQLMATHHYLGFKQLVGESIRYIALLEEQWVALLGWSSAAFKSAHRDQWIGWSEEQRLQRLKYLANNSRFLILPGIQVQNLASKTLALNLKRLSTDWLAVYRHPVMLAETFIDHSRFTGTCYRAAGFVPLGQTQGFGRNAGRYYIHGKAKTIVIRPLHQKTQQWLSTPLLSPALLEGNKYQALADINQLAVDGSGGLMERLDAVADPRMRNGIRHGNAVVLAIAVCAALSGAHSYLDVGRWADTLPQNILKRLGCRIGQKERRYVPPGEATLRRALQAIDIEDLCRTVAVWLSDQGLENAATAVADRLQALRHRARKDTSRRQYPSLAGGIRP